MAQSIKGITIEIGGDTTSLQKALTSVNKEANSLQTELKFVDKALELDPSNVDLTAQKSTLLKEAIENTTSKIDALKQAQERADQLMQQGTEINQAEYRKLEREIAFAESKLIDYNTQLSKTTINLDALSEKVTNVGGSIENMGNKLAGVSTAVGGTGIAAAVMASTYEDSLAKVDTIADTSKVSLEDLSESIIGLSDKTGIASSEIAENVYNAISAGQDTADAVSFVENATTLAKAGFAETGDALDLLTTTLNAYGLEAEQVGEVSDMLIQTQNLGKTTVAELASSMGKVIPSANAMNVGLEQLTASYTVLTAKGIATAEASTYIKSMLNELGDSGTQVGKILQEETGKSFQELMEDGASLGDVLGILEENSEKTGTAFNEIWSSSEAGASAISLLSDGTDAFNNRVEEMVDSAGATQTAFDKLETTSYKVSVMLNQLKNTMIDLGGVILEAIQPALEKASEKVKEFSKWFKDLDDIIKKTIVIVGAIIAALAPVLIVIGKVTQSVGAMIGVMAKLQTAMAVASTKATLAGISLGAIAAPIIAAVAVIRTLIAAFVNLWKNNEEFRNKVTAIWNEVKVTFEEFVQGIVERINELGFDFANITEVITSIWNGFCELLAPVFITAFEIISTTIETVLNVITGILDVFIGLFTGNWEQMWSGIELIVSSMLEQIKAVLQIGLTMLVEIGTMILTMFITAWNEMWTNVKTFFVEIWEGIMLFFQELPERIGFVIGYITASLIQWGIDLITWSAEAIPQFIESVITWFQTLPERIQTFLTEVITKMQTWKTNLSTKGKEAITELIAKIVEAAKSIPSTMMTIGQAIVDGVWAGIEAARDAFMAKVTSFFTGIVNGAKAALGINSPSLVFQEEVGEWIPPGAAKGVENKSNVFTDSIKDMMASAVATSQQALKNIDLLGGTGGVEQPIATTNQSHVSNVTNANQITINAENVDMDHIDEIVDEVNLRLGMAY